MTDPKDAAACMAVAHTVMSPDDIRQHCLALAELVAILDNRLATAHRIAGLPYEGVEDIFPNVYGFVAVCEDEPHG